MQVLRLLLQKPVLQKGVQKQVQKLRVPQ